MNSLNETLSLIRSHRSVRSYKGDPVPADDIRRAVEAGQAAATSSAIQAYCLLHITRPDERRELSELCGSQEHIATCGAFFAPERIGRNRRTSLHVRTDPPDEFGGSYESECRPGGPYGALEIVLRHLLHRRPAQQPARDRPAA